MIIELRFDTKEEKERMAEINRHISSAIGLIAAEISYITEYQAKTACCRSTCLNASAGMAKTAQKLLDGKITALVNVMDFGEYNVQTRMLDEEVRYIVDDANKPRDSESD